MEKLKRDNRGREKSVKIRRHRFRERFPDVLIVLFDLVFLLISSARDLGAFVVSIRRHKQYHNCNAVQR